MAPAGRRDGARHVGLPTTRLTGIAPALVLWLIALAALSACGASSARADSTILARVVKVVDGDTIRVRIGRRTELVRYIGVNAPEINHPDKGAQPYGREAAEANRRLVEGQTVRLEFDVDRRDQYGRLLAYVYVGDRMVNAELVAQGYAQTMTIPPNVRHQRLLRRLEREARRKQLGLWGHRPRSDAGGRIGDVGSGGTSSVAQRPGQPGQSQRIAASTPTSSTRTSVLSAQRPSSSRCEDRSWPHDRHSSTTCMVSHAHGTDRRSLRVAGALEESLSEDIRCARGRPALATGSAQVQPSSSLPGEA